MNCPLDDVSTHKYANFGDLNYDCQLMILELMDFEALLSLSETNKEYASITNEFIRRKLATKTVVLQKKDFDPTADEPELTVVESYTQLLIARANYTRIFEKVGSFIRKLRIDYTWVQNEQDTDTRNVIALANRYCDSLTEFELKTRDAEYLDVVEQPFSNVEVVTLAGDFRAPGSTTWKLNRMFPKMRSLRLLVPFVRKRSDLAEHFPNLEHLHSLGMHIDYVSNTDFKRLIEKNPQIKSLSLHFGSFKFLKFVSEQLPNLEYLDLEYTTTPHDGHVYFRYVKVLKIMPHMTSTDYPLIMTFRKLEEFTLSGLWTNVTAHWVTFIQRHENLQKLYFDYPEIPNAELLTLIGQNRNLTDVKFNLMSDVQSSTLISFVESKDKLTKLELLWNDEMPEQMMNSLEAGIGNQWHINILTPKLLRIEKATSDL